MTTARKKRVSKGSSLSSRTTAAKSRPGVRRKDRKCADLPPPPPDPEVEEEMCYVETISTGTIVGPVRKVHAEWAIRQLAYPDHVRIIPA